MLEGTTGLLNKSPEQEEDVKFKCGKMFALELVCGDELKDLCKADRHSKVVAQ